MKIYRIVKFAAASLLLLASAQASFAGEAMSEAELNRLFPGKFQAVVHGGVKVKFTANSNGVLIGQIEDRKDSGRWSLKDGKLCIMLSRWTSGKSNCSTVVADNGWYKGRGVKFRKI